MGALLVMLVLFVVSAGAATARPAGAQQSAACVRSVPSGTIVDEEGFTFPNGRTLRREPCAGVENTALPSPHADWTNVDYPVYYQGCDNGWPQPPGFPYPPGCPWGARATQTLTATFKVPPEPETQADQILYWNIRVDRVDPDGGGQPPAQPYINMISAGVNWNNNQSGSKWTTCVWHWATLLPVDIAEFSEPIEVSPGDIVTASITRTATGYTGTVNTAGSAGRQSTMHVNMATDYAQPLLALQATFFEPNKKPADCAKLPTGPMIMSEVAISPMPGTAAQPVFAGETASESIFYYCKWTQSPDWHMHPPAWTWPMDGWANRTLILNPPRKPPTPPPPPPPPPAPPTPQMYLCTSWSPPCQPCPPTTPNATTLAKCNATCGARPPPPPPAPSTKYACESSTHTCSPSATGPFASKATCELDC